MQRAWVGSEQDRQLLQRQKNIDGILIHVIICSEWLILAEIIEYYNFKDYCLMFEYQVFSLVCN